MPEHISFYGNDIREFSFTHRAKVFVYAHGHGRPVGGCPKGVHGIKSEFIDPHVQLVPRTLTMELHGYAAVGAHQQYYTGVFELLHFFFKGGLAQRVKLEIRELTRLPDRLFDILNDTIGEIKMPGSVVKHFRIITYVFKVV